MIFGVAPPEEKSGVVAVTEVTVPCGCAVQVNEPPVQVRAFVPVQVESPKPLIKAPNRLVEEAVVEKKLVVVAFVVVLFPVMIRLESMVEDAVERKPFKKPKRVEVDTPQDCTVHEKVPEPPVGHVVRQTSPVKQSWSVMIDNHAIVEGVVVPK